MDNSVKKTSLIIKVDPKKYARKINELRHEILHINHDYEGKVVVHIFAFNMDMILRDIIEDMLIQLKGDIKRKIKSELSIVATGGYGRGQLNLFSDIDIMFLTTQNVSEETLAFISKVLSLMWDCKLEVGHSVRNISQCLDCIGTDLKSATSFLKTRLIWGSKSNYEEFRKKILIKIRGEGREWWIRERLSVMKIRREKYGDNVYLMEPNIKEGEGGLRDIEFISWIRDILKGEKMMIPQGSQFIVKREYLALLNDAQSFLLRLRNEMHSLKMKRDDLLTYEKQIIVAKKLNYKKSRYILPEENLMHDYYRHAKFVNKLARQGLIYLETNLRYLIPGEILPPEKVKISRHLSILNGFLSIDQKMSSIFRKEPSMLLKIFAESAKHRAPLSMAARELVISHLNMVDDDFRNSPENANIFLEILKTFPGLGIALDEMHETGFLNAFIPEFKRIECLVRVDFYHRYTTDEHSILAVKECEKLFIPENKQPRHPEFSIAAQIRKPEYLILAVLLHDIGKGEGKGHALRGAKIAQRITSRFNLPAETRDLIRKLVMYHLRLAHVSQRRNLDDPTIIKYVADEIGDAELLKMLYLLTFADMKAVAPDAFNEWKANLLFELVSKTIHYLEGKPLEEKMALTIPENLESEIIINLEKIGAKYNRQDIARFIEAAPDKYLAVNLPDQIARHFLMLNRINQDNQVAIEKYQPEDAKYSEIVICGYDEPGFFYKVCAALSSKDINILGAQIFSTKDGFCIDIFQVTDLKDNPLHPDISFDRTQKLLNSVLKNEADIQVFMPAASLKKSSRFIVGRIQDIPVKILFDNETSATHTIIEVKATDQPWLLYKITSTLAAARLNIDLSLISTEAYRVVDVFYVTDLESNKLIDISQQKKIEKALLETLEEKAE